MPGLCYRGFCLLSVSYSNHRTIVLILLKSKLSLRDPSSLAALSRAGLTLLLLHRCVKSCRARLGLHCCLQVGPRTRLKPSPTPPPPPAACCRQRCHPLFSRVSLQALRPRSLQPTTTAAPSSCWHHGDAVSWWRTSSPVIPSTGTSVSVSAVLLPLPSPLIG